MAFFFAYICCSSSHPTTEASGGGAGDLGRREGFIEEKLLAEMRLPLGAEVAVVGRVYSMMWTRTKWLGGEGEEEENSGDTNNGR